jgi:hypothetical protein
MKLEARVTSVELSNRLHKLGVIASSLYYREWTGAKASEIEAWGEPSYCEDNVNCFTVSELGEMLPKWTLSWRDTDDYEEEGVKYGRAYVCGREHEMKERGEDFFVADTEADARAKMLIYLLEKETVKVEAGA